jgi:hypothetical protein
LAMAEVPSSQALVANRWARSQFGALLRSIEARPAS